MTPSLCGWEAFPTPGALTHTWITWAFSPPAPQVPGITPGSPCAHGVSGIHYGEVRDRLRSGDFTTLANIARLSIIMNILSHFWPPKMSLNILERLTNTHMTTLLHVVDGVYSLLETRS
jgi:hypothetical protein